MAERLMADRCKQLSGWTFASAGLFARDGAPPSELAVKVLQEIGIDLSDHRARLLTAELIDQADVIIALTGTHRDLILETTPQAAGKTRTLHSYGSEKPHADVMDPYGGAIDTYRIARDEISGALNDVLLAEIHPQTL